MGEHLHISQKAVSPGSKLNHRITEILSCKKPIRIKSNPYSLQDFLKLNHIGMSVIQTYLNSDSLVPGQCFRSGLPALIIKVYCVNNSLVLIQKMSLQTVDKGVFVLVHIQAQVTQADWFDVGQVVWWMGSFITLSLSKGADLLCPGGVCFSIASVAEF